jgi:hypothetical protein
VTQIELEKQNAKIRWIKAFTIAFYCALIAVIGFLILFILGTLSADIGGSGGSTVIGLFVGFPIGIIIAGFLLVGLVSLIIALIRMWFWSLKYKYQKQKKRYISWTIFTVIVLIALVFFYTNFGMLGSMKSKQIFSCLKADQIRNEYTPVDLLKSHEACLKENNFEDAVFLRELLVVYAKFDVTRARYDFITNIVKTRLFDKVDAQIALEQKERYYEVRKKQDQKTLCSATERIGIPKYYPAYMVPWKGTKSDFNPKLEWKKMMAGQCPAIFTGNMESLHDIGCITASQVTNQYTPVDLLKGYAQCVKHNNFNDAAFLHELAFIYYDFDKARVENETDAAQAIEALFVLREQLRNQEDPEKNEAFSRFYRYRNENDQQQGVVCRAIKQIGMPSYYPRYMTAENGLRSDFDADSSWKKVPPGTCRSFNFDEAFNYEYPL